jgi:hypothetical protein
MIIWRGWGALVFFIIFIVSLAANFVANILGGNGYWNTHGWPLASALIIAGGLIWIIDLYLFKKPGRVLVDEKTGERVTLANNNDFFFIPMKWWGPISAAADILILATNWVPGP